MTSTKPLTTSERSARFILSAWNRREFTALQAALAQLPFAQPETLPAEERERVDLIHDPGCKLLVRDGSGQGETGTNPEAALVLMRHLARCE